MDASIVQTISQVVIFLGASVAGVCNYYKDKRPAAQTAGRGLGNWRAWINKNARRIILCSAIAIAIGAVSNSISSGIASRSTSERFNQQIRDLQQDNDSLLVTLEPIATFSETSGLSIQQAIAKLLDYRSAETAQERKRQAVVAVSDFYRMLKNYDAHFKEKSFDSAVFNISQITGLRSGENISSMIIYAEDARRKRDNLIDSALVRLTQLDVNIDTLRFDRKLPIRIGRALHWSAKAAGFDATWMRKVLQCDTL